MNFGWSTAETTRLNGCSDWLELEFVERERQPSELMNLSIRLHLVELSLSNTISEFENFGVQRSQKAVHDWVQKVDLQPADDVSPDHITLNETVIQINGQQYWLYAAVDTETTSFSIFDYFRRQQRHQRQNLCENSVKNTMFLKQYFSLITLTIFQWY